MVGQLQPMLNTNIVPVGEVRQPDISAAFSGFFRDMRASSSGPSNADLNRQSELVFGNEMRKALILRDSNPVASRQVASQAWLGLVESGVEPGQAQRDLYFSATGTEPAAAFHGSQDEYNEAVWLASEEAAPFKALSEKILTEQGKDFTQEQVDTYARVLFEGHAAGEKALELEKQRVAMGLTPDGTKINSALQSDFNIIMGFTRGATADGRVTQDEIQNASRLLSEMIGTKYAPFMGEGGNPEVKSMITEMQKMVENLGNTQFDNKAALMDELYAALAGTDLSPAKRAIMIELIGSPYGMELLLEQGGKTVSELFDALGEVSDTIDNPEERVTSSNPNIVDGNPANPGTHTIKPPTTPEETATHAKALEAVNMFSNGDFSESLSRDPNLRESFVNHAITAANIVGAQQDTVLGKKLLAQFASPQFVANLNALFSTDEEAAVKVATAYQSALGTELTRLQLNMESISSERAEAILSMNEKGEVQLDYSFIEEKVAASGDPMMKEHWKGIKTLIENEGIEGYLRNDAHLGSRSTDIDAFAGTRLRETLKLIDNARTVMDKVNRIQHLIDKNQEAFVLYGDQSLLSQQDQGRIEEAVQQADAEAIAGEAAQARGNTISTHTLPPMEQVAAPPPPPPGMTQAPPAGLNPMMEEDPAWVAENARPDLGYGTRENPWPISWSEGRTDDEELFNQLPIGAWFIDPDGQLRKKLGNIPVEGK